MIIGAVGSMSVEACLPDVGAEADTQSSPNETVLPFLVAVAGHASRTPDKRALIFLGDGRNETDAITYKELQTRALRVADHLTRAGLANIPVLLLYPPGIEFVVALLGCFYAGAIAVPAPYPSAGRTRSRMEAIAKDARPKAVLSCVAYVEGKKAQIQDAAIAALPLIASDALAVRSGFDAPAIAPDSIALVQYSSGSTGSPKGVMITHANLSHNQDMLRRVFGHGPDLIGVSWCPATHDMGLIGGLLHPLYCGASCVVLPSLYVLQRPRLWLEAISRYRATTSMAPVFAYDLCTKRISPAERSQLDLRSWGVAICGAEPVRPRILEDFAAAFGPVGFSPRALSPAYGLAEGTLLVAAHPKSTGPRTRDVDGNGLDRGEIKAPEGGRSHRFVSCGNTHSGQQLHIVNPETRQIVKPGSVGEIWVRGGSISRGYWNRATETEEVFRAHLADGSDVHYLRTGDLGFMAGNDLFVTGRLKEMLIVRGVNYYPQDIEQSIQLSAPIFDDGQACAFGVESDGQEAVIVIFEPARTRMRTIDPYGAAELAIGALSQSFGLRLHDFVLVRFGTLPRTTSGKLQRRQCRDLYASGNLPALGPAIEHPALGKMRARNEARVQP